MTRNATRSILVLAISLSIASMMPDTTATEFLQTDVELVEINKGQTTRAVECAAPGPGNTVHQGNGRGLAFDPHHNNLFYSELPWDVIYRVDADNARPQGGSPQVCRLLDSCPVIFPDGSSLPIGAMAFQDRNEFDPPAPLDVLWLAPYDGGGFAGIGDIWQLAIDTDSPDPFYPLRDAAGVCRPVLASFAPLGRGPQCPDIGNGFPDGLEFDPSPDIPGSFSLWISDDASDLIYRLAFPSNPAATFLSFFSPSITRSAIHKCNTGIAVDPTGGDHPVWLNEFAIDFRLFNIEEVFFSQRSRDGLDRVFEAAAYDLGLFGAHDRDRGVRNARAWEDAEFDETDAFWTFGQRCGVWMVDDGTTILRSGDNIPSNELQFIRFDVPCGRDEMEALDRDQRRLISMTKKLHNNGPENPVQVRAWDKVSAPEGCDVSYLTQDAEEIIVNAGVPFLEILPPSTVVFLGIGPASFVPGPDRRILIPGRPGVDFEFEIVTNIPGPVPIGPPVNFHQEFDKHCSEGGVKVFQFCSALRPGEPIAETDPSNNDGCVTEIVSVPEECDPNPDSQGFWHRQCLGLPADPSLPPNERGIDPGRNGRGPQSPTLPDFLKLTPSVGLYLENKLFEFDGACAGGMDADPPSDPCQKARKQYTAMLFNIVSGRLQLSCGVDLSAEGCTSADLSGLSNEIAALINSGDPGNCKTAAGCAAAINEGDGILPSSGMGTRETGPDSSAAPPMALDAGPNYLRPAPSGEPVREALAPAPVDDTISPIVLLKEKEGDQAADPQDAEVEEETPADGADPVTEIQRMLAVLANTSAPESAREVARDALLEALGGGYEVGLRLMVVEALVDVVDPAYHSLLARHLVDIRDEAVELELEQAAGDAARLLKRLGRAAE